MEFERGIAGVRGRLLGKKEEVTWPEFPTTPFKMMTTAKRFRLFGAVAGGLMAVGTLSSKVTLGW